MVKRGNRQGRSQGEKLDVICERLPRNLKIKSSTP